jgi:hypothetical protein
VSTAGRHHLGRLAEQSFERRGDYPALLFKGRWPGSEELFETVSCPSWSRVPTVSIRQDMA